MANSQELTKFIVWAPDHTDAEAPARRRAVQPKHFEGIHQLIKDGTLRKHRTARPQALGSSSDVVYMAQVPVEAF